MCALSRLFSMNKSFQDTSRNGRGGKLLGSHRSLIFRPAQSNKHGLDETNAFSHLRIDRAKNQPVNHRGERKELFQQKGKPPFRYKGTLKFEPPIRPMRKDRVKKPNRPFDHRETFGPPILALSQKDRVKKTKRPFHSRGIFGITSISHKDLVKKPKYLGSLPEPTLHSVDSGKTYTISKDQLIGLRAHWSKKCDKAAAKACKKGCRTAMKAACLEFTCKGKLKRSFKKQCKVQCNSMFIVGGGGGGGSGSGSGSNSGESSN